MFGNTINWNEKKIKKKTLKLLELFFITNNYSHMIKNKILEIKIVFNI